MFDIGFSELLLVLVIGLVVLGPERLPVAVRTVAGWIRTLRAMAASVQNELSQELKLQELQDSLKKAEESGLKNLSPEIQSSIDDLKEMAESMKRSLTGDLEPITPAVKDATAAGNTIYNPAVQDAEALHDEGHFADKVPEPAVVTEPKTASPLVPEETVARSLVTPSPSVFTSSPENSAVVKPVQPSQPTDKP